MATYTQTLDGSYYLRLVINQASQDIAANTSTVSWSLTLVQTAGTGRWLFTASHWSATINGTTYSGSTTYDFRNYDELVLGSGSLVVAHNADGTKSITASGVWDCYNTNIPDGSVSGPLTLTTIPRASTPTLSPNPVDAGVETIITTNRASTTFTHTLEYTFGTASGTIATDVAESQAWTPPLSLLTEIPNATSGVGTLTTKTYSGATQIGTTNVPFTINVPASVVPDFTTVTHSENVTLVATEVGAYVKSLSKLNLAITGAAGVYGSTISSYKIQTGSHIILASSGVTGFLATAGTGTVAIVGTVTDSRGRSKSKTVFITVLDYTPPAIDTTVFGVSRADVTGTPAEEGTYIRVDLKANVQSLLVSAVQKNALTYKISTRARGDTVWTLKSTTTPGGVAFDSFALVGTYAVEGSFEVLVEVLDKFQSSNIIDTIATANIFMQWGEGLGVGKFWERGSLDVKEQIYQNDGQSVVSVNAGDLAPGVVPTYNATTEAWDLTAPAGYLLGVAYPWMSDTIPTWGLELNGQTIAGGATTYSGLAALYPSWVSGADLVLPDWRTRTPVGHKSGDATFGTLGALIGEATHTLTIAEMPSHSHTLSRAQYGNTRIEEIPFSSGAAPQANVPQGVNATGGGGAHNNVQPSVVVKWVVCAATSSGDFDTEVQTALVARMGAAEAAIDLLEYRPQGRIPSSVVVGSGSATVASDGTVTFTDCSSVSLNGVFDGAGSDLYEAQIVWRGTTDTTNLLSRLRAGGTDYTTSDYVKNMMYSSSGGTPTGATSTEPYVWGGYHRSGFESWAQHRIAKPMKAVRTVVFANFWTVNAIIGMSSAVVTPTTAFDGYTIFPLSGTITGTIKVVRVA